MSQVRLSVPEKIARVLRKKAKAHGVSLSRYLAQLVTRDVNDAWPEGFFEEVIGGWKGNPLERPPQGNFEVRKRL